MQLERVGLPQGVLHKLLRGNQLRTGVLKRIYGVSPGCPRCVCGETRPGVGGGFSDVAVNLNRFGRSLQTNGRWVPAEAI